MKKIIILTISLFLVNLIFSLFLFTQIRAPKEESKVVDLSKLYVEFAMTTELSKKFEKISEYQEGQLDSMNQTIKELEFKMNTTKDQVVKDNLFATLNDVKNRNQDLMVINEKTKIEFEQQIWNQLNTYMMEFGNQSSYPVILGSKNDGNILYMDAENDVTAQLIEFANNKYKGRL